MSDTYQALIDPSATPSEAASLAAAATGCLFSHGLIRTDLSARCVLGEEGYPAGPACPEVYVPGPGELPFWTREISGVEVLSAPWVNLFGLPLFNRADCPACGHRHGTEFTGQIAMAVEAFVKDGRVPTGRCSACGDTRSLHEWHCAPHPGFTHLALVFWNWPPFEAPGWRKPIPLLLGRTLKRPLVATRGQV